MKKNIRNQFAKSLALVLISYSCFAQQTDVKNTATIYDLKNKNVPKIIASKHKAHTIEVFKNARMHNQYLIVFYQKEQNNMVAHKAMTTSGENFDKATYHWLNDTTVAIRLMNVATKKELEIKVFGNGSSTGVILPD